MFKTALSKTDTQENLDDYLYTLIKCIYPFSYYNFDINKYFNNIFIKNNNIKTIDEFIKNEEIKDYKTYLYFNDYFAEKYNFNSKISDNLIYITKENILKNLKLSKHSHKSKKIILNDNNIIRINLKNFIYNIKNVMFYNEQYYGFACYFENSIKLVLSFDINYNNYNYEQLKEILLKSIKNEEKVEKLIDFINILNKCNYNTYCLQQLYNFLLYNGFEKYIKFFGINGLYEEPALVITILLKILYQIDPNIFNICGLKIENTDTKENNYTFIYNIKEKKEEYDLSDIEFEEIIDKILNPKLECYIKYDINDRKILEIKKEDIIKLKPKIYKSLKKYFKLFIKNNEDYIFGGDKDKKDKNYQYKKIDDIIKIHDIKNSPEILIVNYETLFNNLFSRHNLDENQLLYISFKNILFKFDKTKCLNIYLNKVLSKKYGDDYKIYHTFKDFDDNYDYVEYNPKLYNYKLRNTKIKINHHIYNPIYYLSY